MRGLREGVAGGCLADDFVAAGGDGLVDGVCGAECKDDCNRGAGDFVLHG